MSSLGVVFGLILLTVWRHHDGQTALNQLAQIIDYRRPRLVKAQIIRILEQINDVFNRSLAIAPAPQPSADGVKSISARENRAQTNLSVVPYISVLCFDNHSHGVFAFFAHSAAICDG